MRIGTGVFKIKEPIVMDTEDVVIGDSLTVVMLTPKLITEYLHHTDRETD